MRANATYQGSGKSNTVVARRSHHCGFVWIESTLVWFDISNVVLVMTNYDDLCLVALFVVVLVLGRFRNPCGCL